MLEKLGPYLIDEQIGKGGMGFVYSARHEDTDAEVAVKMLASTFADDHNFRDRFQQEIETLQQLQHPGIVQIIGYGQEQDILYYAMELVKGRTLFQILRESGTFTWREVIRITIDICYALKHAHDRGVIHRDLKPSNLFLTEDDEVKLPVRGHPGAVESGQPAGAHQGGDRLARALPGHHRGLAGC